MNIRKSTGLCTLFMGMQLYVTMPTNMMKSSAKFMGNYLQLKANMPCEHVVLKPRPGFYSKTTSNYRGESLGSARKARLSLASVTPQSGKNGSSTTYKIIKEVDISPRNEPFPYVHLYFDNAGGQESPAHYRLTASRTVLSDPFQGNVQGEEFRDEPISVDTLFEIVDMNTRGCAGRKGAQIEVGNK